MTPIERNRPQLPIATRLTLLALVTAGCLACEGLGDDGIAFPGRARVGDTVGMAVGGNSVGLNIDLAIVEGSGEIGPTPLYSFDRNSLSIAFEEWPSGTLITTVTPRVVLPIGIDPTAKYYPSSSDDTAIIAVFEVPSSLSDYVGQVVRIGPSAVTQLRADLEILPGVGAATVVNEPPLSDLERRPTVRLVASKGPGAPYPEWDPSWTIGSLSFDLSYPSALTTPVALARSDAARGIVLVRDDPGTSTLHVMLLHPDGFDFTQVLNQPQLMGNGVLLDVIFDPSEESFDEGDFVLSHLVMTDTDGVPHAVDFRNADPDPSGDYFLLRALPQLPPSP